MKQKPRSTADRLPPHSIEAEQGVLGCILLDPVVGIDTASTVFGDRGEEHFYDLRHWEIFATLERMAAKRVKIDIHTLHERLKSDGKLEAVGGIGFVSSLPDCVPSASNLEYYLGILKEKADRRRALKVFASLTQRIMDGDEADIIEEAEIAILGIRKVTETRYRSLAEITPQAFDAMAAMYRRGRDGKIGGISTGFERLDRFTDGLQAGQLWLVAGHTASGKSTWAMNIAEAVAVQQGVSTGVFSMEMGDVQLAQRMLCSIAGINRRDVRMGDLDPIPSLSKPAHKMSVAPMHIDTTRRLTLEALAARARRMHQKEKIQFMVVDYIQLMSSQGAQKNRSRADELDAIGNGLKIIAGELGIPVLGVAQLSEEGKIRGSQGVSMAGDVVGKLMPEGDEERGVIRTNLFLQKIRDEEAMLTVPFDFRKRHSRFVEAVVDK
jgi:replicative DNA helicase